MTFEQIKSEYSFTSNYHGDVRYEYVLLITCLSTLKEKEIILFTNYVNAGISHLNKLFGTGFTITDISKTEPVKIIAKKPLKIYGVSTD